MWFRPQVTLRDGLRAHAEGERRIESDFHQEVVGDDDDAVGQAYARREHGDQNGGGEQHEDHAETEQNIGVRITGKSSALMDRLRGEDHPGSTGSKGHVIPGSSSKAQETTIKRELR